MQTLHIYMEGEWEMKTNVVDVLLYMFEHYDDIELEDATTDAGHELVMLAETRRLEETLANEGFEDSEIDKAISWLDDLSSRLDELEADDKTKKSSSGLRMYSEDELDALGVENCDFLHYLENAGVLQAAQRELIIERVMALNVTEIDLEQFQWMMLLVFANQPSQDEAYTWVEELLYKDQVGLPS